MKYFPISSPLDRSRFKSATQWIWATVAVIGFALLWVGGVNVQRMLMYPGWPTVTGVIEKSELKRGFMREGSLKHQYEISYRYTVNGKTYQGGRVSFAKVYPAAQNIQRLLATYRSGQKVAVRYHPKHPALAAIEDHVSWQGFKLGLFGVTLAGLGGVGFFYRWPLQTDYLFRQHNPEKPLTISGVVLGTLGMLTCLGIVWLWWELIKMYAGR